MKLLFLVYLVGLASATGYHKAVGIPLAESIRIEETSPKARITNGNYARLGANPFFGGLLIVIGDYVSVCGSSIITNTKLVTAAHCWCDGELVPDFLQVVLGSTTLFGGGTRINTDRVTVHEEFNLETIRNDIAIVAVPAVTFNAYIKPIKLPGNTRSRYVGVRGRVVGYGKTNDTMDIGISQTLSYAEVTVSPDRNCLIYGSAFASSMMCAEGDRFSGPCGGDSGGPLVYRNDADEDILIGIVSYGSVIGCTLGLPVVYTRTTSYVKWIENKL